MVSRARVLSPESFTHFGELLRYLRRRARLTLQELALAVHFSEGHLSRLENGSRLPDVTALRTRFVPALGLDADPAWADRLLALASEASRARSEPETAHERASTPPITTQHNLADGLIATKLFVPRLRADAVPRQRLLAHLDASAHAALTLVVAPAGFGKTTLLAEWALRAAKPAWLSLDANDSRLDIFLRYLVAAAQRVAPVLGTTTLALLQSPAPLPLATLLTPLINDLVAFAAAGQALTLVLDDYHAIAASDVHAAVAYLVEFGASALHLLIASRVEPPLPLPRLRARGQLRELRADELRFTQAESAAFLRSAAGVTLASGDLATLDARTEGWAAGLQLAALTLQSRSNLTEPLAALTGSSRYIADYLAKEVLSGLPPHLRSFLLRTAILEQLCASLCAAVLGKPDDDGERAAQAAIEQIERANLFIVALDDERRWFRFHHLFGELLRAQLQRGADRAAVAELHRRACGWYEARGLADAALHHALAADDDPLAVGIVERQAATMIDHGAYEALQRLIDRLPEQAVETRPRLALAQAALATFAGKLTLAEDLLARAEALAAGRADAIGDWLDHTAAVALVIRAVGARVAGDARRAYELAQAALETGPGLHPALRLWARFEGGVALSLLNEFDAARATLAGLVGEIDRTANPSLLLSALSDLGRLTAMQGQLRDAVRAYERILRQGAPETVADEGNMLMLQVGLAGIYYEWNALDAAHALIEACIGEARRQPRALALALGHTIRAQIALARADADAARADFDEIGKLLPALQSPFFSELLLLCGYARAWLELATHDAARFWEQLAPLARDDAASSRADLQRLAQARLLLAQGEPRAAMAELEPLLGAAAGGRRGVAIKALVLGAAIEASVGGEAAALAALERALALAEADGYVRTFVDEGAAMGQLLTRFAAGKKPGDPLRAYAERILAAFPAPTGAPNRSQRGAVANNKAASVGEALTGREREVLELLATGNSNRAIAAALDIGPGTVKRHLHNIFGKLGAENRTEAIARARAMGFI